MSSREDRAFSFLAGGVILVGVGFAACAVLAF
jgi:hypothetical protein